MDPVHHRLAAVCFADIAGYSALAATDEDEAVRLAGAFQDAVRAVVEPRGGRLVKMLGDGCVAEFPSTRSAIGAAVGLHEAFAERAPGPRSPKLRIGVHVGD